MSNLVAPRWRLLGLALALGLVMSAVAWLATRTPRRQSCRLPDGSELSLAKVTFGKKHEFQYDGPFHRFINSLRPLFSAPRVRVATLTSADTNGLVVWFWRRGGMWTDLSYQLAAVDDHGNQGNQAPSSSSPAVRCTVKPGIELDGWELREWPRRSKTIRLRLYVVGNLSPVAEFSLVNPLHETLRTWSPEPLPATKRTNDLELTLLNFATGLTAREASVANQPWVSTRVQFTVKEAGEPSRDWEVTRVVVKSPWGEYPFAGFGRTRSNFVQGVDLWGALWPDEPAWRLRIELSRWLNFKPSEIWKINGVPVPEPGKLIEMRTVTNMCNMEIEFLGISGANAALGEEFVAMSNSSNVHVRSPYPVDDVHIILLDAVDDQGRYVPCSGTSTRPSAGGRGITLKELLQGFAITIPEGAKTLDLTFAVTRSQYFEFQVKPTLAHNLPR